MLPINFTVPYHQPALAIISKCNRALDKDDTSTKAIDKNLASDWPFRKVKTNSHHAYLVRCESFVSWARFRCVYTTYLRSRIPVLPILTNVLKTASCIFLGPLTEGSSSKNACACINKHIAVVAGVSWRVPPLWRQHTSACDALTSKYLLFTLPTGNAPCFYADLGRQTFLLIIWIKNFLLVNWFYL